MIQSPYYEALSGQFSIAYKDSSQPHKRINHIHDPWEVTFVLSPCAQVWIGDEKRDVPANSVLLFNSLDLHRIQVADGCEYRRYVLWLSAEYLSCFAQGQEYMLTCFFYRPFPDSQILPLEADEARQLQALLDKLILAAHDATYGHEMLERLLTGQLLLHINRSYLRFHGIREELLPARFRTVYSCMHYIHTNLDKELSLEDLSSRLYISRRRLNDLFCEVTGISPGHYILNCRLQKAKACLSQGMSVDQTCAECGFGNLSHFIRIFKKYQHITPKQYMLKNSVQN